MIFWERDIDGPNIAAYIFNIGKTHYYVNISADDISTITKSEVKEILKIERQWHERRVTNRHKESLPQYLTKMIFEYQAY